MSKELEVLQQRVWDKSKPEVIFVSGEIIKIITDYRSLALSEAKIDTYCGEGALYGFVDLGLVTGDWKTIYYFTGMNLRIRKEPNLDILVNAMSESWELLNSPSYKLEYPST